MLLFSNHTEPGWVQCEDWHGSSDWVLLPGGSSCKEESLPQLPFTSKTLQGISQHSESENPPLSSGAEIKLLK